MSGCHVVLEQGKCCLLRCAFGFVSGRPVVLEQGKDCLMCSTPTCRLSPKAGRKDRGRQLRSKRERASSPSAREAPLMRARSSSASLILDRAREPVKQVGRKPEVEYFHKACTVLFPHCEVGSRLVSGTFISVGAFPSSIFSSVLYISRGYEYGLLVNKRNGHRKES